MRFPENHNAKQWLIAAARNHSKWCKVAIGPEIAFDVHDLTLTTLIKRIMIHRRRAVRRGAQRYVAFDWRKMAFRWWV
jgi:hypothetical protein